MNKCMICNSENVQLKFEFPCSITSFSTPADIAVQVLLCSDCGHIFNPPSQLPACFYEHDYSLLLGDNKSEFVIFNAGSEISLFEKVVKFISPYIDKHDHAKSVNVLEVGAGKGLLLQKLKAKYQNKLQLHAVEPNKKSEQFLVENLPDCNLSMSTLDESPFAQKTFDIVMSHGVLEHVGDPVGFLKDIYACMDIDSLLYIGVPNFVANPSDLVTTDHLSKFTPSSIKYLFDKVGFDVVESHSDSTEVFMMFLLKKGKARTALNSEMQVDISCSESTLNKSIDFVNLSMQGFKDALTECRNSNRAFSMYGAGNIGLLACSYYENDDCLQCIYDDNNTFWGTQRIGLPIRDPKELSVHTSPVVYISANPCYYNLIKEKIDSITDKRALVYPVI